MSLDHGLMLWGEGQNFRDPLAAVAHQDSCELVCP